MRLHTIFLFLRFVLTNAIKNKQKFYSIYKNMIHTTRPNQLYYQVTRHPLWTCSLFETSKICPARFLESSGTCVACLSVARPSCMLSDCRELVSCTHSSCTHWSVYSSVITHSTNDNPQHQFLFTWLHPCTHPHQQPAKFSQ